MPRFVILIHDFPFVHWDLLLEQDESLRSWRLLESPARWLLAITPPTIPAESISDHRLDYLDYEGPVSRERGTVARWDAGTFERSEQSDDHVRLRLLGEQLRGELRLDRMRDAPLWTARFETVPADQAIS